MDEFSYLSSFSSHPPPSPPVPNPYSNTSLVTSSFAHPPPKAENPNFTLPDHTLFLKYFATFDFGFGPHHVPLLDFHILLHTISNEKNSESKP